jgi:hypothetical protein
MRVNAVVRCGLEWLPASVAGPSVYGFSAGAAQARIAATVYLYLGIAVSHWSETAIRASCAASSVDAAQHKSLRLCTCAQCVLGRSALGLTEMVGRARTE